MNKNIKKLLQVFACICVFSFFVIGVSFNSGIILPKTYAQEDYLCPEEGCFGSYINGFCNHCGGYQKAKLTTGQYDLDEVVQIETVYEISNAGQLYWFADKVRNENGSYGSASAVLTADIIVNEDVLIEDIDGNITLNEDIFDDFRIWTPIGGMVQDTVNPESYSLITYNGYFDGQHHKISGLYFNNSSIDYVGLFGAVRNSNNPKTIKNISVVDSYLCGEEFVGGIVGQNSQSTTINCCYTENSILKATSKLGGITGANYGKIENCYNLSVLEASNTVGGIVGILTVENASVSNSLNMGAVAGNTYVGGVVGRRQSGANIINCYYLQDCATDGVIIHNGVGSAVNGESVENLLGETFTQSLQAISNGETTFLLNNENQQENYVWGQNIDKSGTKDLHPVFSADLVYKNVDCDGTTLINFSNTQHIKEHYYIIEQNQNKLSVECDICKKAFDITVNAPQNAVYDSASKPATITTTEEGLNLEISYTGVLNSGSSYVSNNAPTNAGNYNATINFNGVSATVNFTIERALLGNPNIKGKPYTGSNQVAEVDLESTIYDVIRNNGGTNVGAYDVVLKLKSTSNWRWVNSSTDELIVKFNIEQANNSWVITPYIHNWHLGETPIIQNGRTKFGNEVVVEYRLKDGTTDNDYTTKQPEQTGEYYVRFTVPGTNNYLTLTHIEEIKVSEYLGSGNIGAISTPASKSPRNTPKGLPALAILGIVTLSVCAVFGLGIGIYHWVEKIKKDRKENKDKVR